MGANRSVVEKLLQVWGKAKVLKAGIQWLAGALPTPIWLAAKGWNIEAKCTNCGENRDLAHETTGCLSAELMPGRNGMRASVRKTEALVRGACRAQDGDRKNDIDWEGDIEAWENGVRVPWKDFWFKAGFDIYSDGSALDTKYRGLARGAGAAVQRTEEGGWRGFIIRVPFGLPKGAAVPEQLAASLALTKMCGQGRRGRAGLLHSHGL